MARHKEAKTKKRVSNIDKVYCRMCMKNKSESNFYEATYPLIDKNGLLSVCKDCCADLYKHYYSIHGNVEDALRLTCRDLDVCFNLEALKQTKSHVEKLKSQGKPASAIFGYYKSKLSSTNKNNTKMESFRYKDSDFFKDDYERENYQNVVSKPNEFEVTSEMVEFWGRGYSQSDYEFLEKEKPHWFDRYKCDNRGEEILYKQICYQLLDINKAREEGREVAKMLDTLQKLMESANVKPKDANALSDADNIDSFGIRIRDIELYEPAEYFEDKDLYRDFSGIENYFNKWVVRPMKNLLRGSRDFEVGDED